MSEIAQVRAFLAEFLGPADTPVSVRIEKSRAFAEAAVTPEGVTIEAGELAGVPVEWVVPAGAGASPLFLHLHGGGYVMGDPAGSRPFTTQLALAARARILSVDYALAPRRPFPAAVEDALAVYRGLIEGGVPPGAVAVGGESAGGGLAIAALLAARDEGLPMPACAVAMSAWADLTCRDPSYVANAAADPLLTRAILLEMARSYLAGADARHPWASPALADLTGLPPLLIQVGADEVLLGDARALARRASDCGVAATLEVWDEMIHVWHMFHPTLAEGALAIARVAAFAAAHWSTMAEAMPDPHNS